MREEFQQAFPDLPAGMDVGSTLVVYPGSLDLKNHYVSNVIVLAGQALEPRGCSGVLITPDTVLTAAHCVCAERAVSISDRKKIETWLNQAFPSRGRSDKSRNLIETWKRNILNAAYTLVDSSRCADEVEVTLITYLSPPAIFTPSTYQGSAVRPHPRFLSIDDSEHHGLFREADLAIIHLNRAVAGNVRTIHLPRAEVYLNQRLVMIGYGLGETQYPMTTFGFRHFGESWVTQIERFASGSTRFSAKGQERDRSEAARAYGGDSGGGVFSQADDTMLMGIISASSERQGSIVESVYPHVKWLEAEMD